ncbi:cyclic nucleotide-binding domain-containing protein [Actinacidiphila sp. SB3-2]
MALAREVSFPAGSRIFAEGGRADRFWIIRSGSVALEAHVPGRRAPVVEVLTHGRLLGWSWLLPPHRWQLGARAESAVHAYEFDAAEVRALADRDPVLGRSLALLVASAAAQRLQAARKRLPEAYAATEALPEAD